MTTTFIPRGQEGLLLRSPLTQNYLPPSYYNKSLLYSRNIRPQLSHRDEASILKEGSVPQRIGFYTRHNPHPGRVRHMKGLLDVPICIVEDNYERHLLYSPPTGEDYSSYYRPTGNTRYSANKEKQIPAIGIVPVTYAWKEELEKKTHKALNKALGEFSVPSSRQGQKIYGEFDSLGDDQILDLLCRILQTSSIPACQAWLNSCSESEKTIVLNMLRMAATGEIDPYPRPTTTTGQIEPQYRMTPDQTASKYQQQSMDSLPPIDNTHMVEPSSFKLPQHDTIVREAHSRLYSRQSERSSFHDRLQTELDNQVHATARLNTSSRRYRSNSLSGQPNVAMGNDCHRPGSSRGTRPRSRSAGAHRPATRDSVLPSFPPPPVHVNVTQEKLQNKGRY